MIEAVDALEFTRRSRLGHRCWRRPGGLRRLELAIGDMTVEVWGLPARSLQPAHWRLIQQARRSYRTMWGGWSNGVEEDRFDGFGDGPYDTRHFIARVTDGADCKVLTMRIVSLRPEDLDERQVAEPGDLLPSDIRWWQTTGGEPLWPHLRAHARQLAPGAWSSEFRIASVSRIATLTPAEGERPQRKRERSAIGFAAMMLLATAWSTDLRYILTVCPEFADHVFGLTDAGCRYISPAITSTEEALGMPTGTLRLDRGQEDVRRHLLEFPGYFVGSGAEVIRDLLDAGAVAPEDFRGAIASLLAHAPDRTREQLTAMRVGIVDPKLTEQEAREVAAGERVAPAPWFDRRKRNHDLARFLTTPPNFKHLIPRYLPLKGAEPKPFAGMTAADFREQLLTRTDDRPFSALLDPRVVASRSKQILLAALEKYA